MKPPTNEQLRAAMRGTTLPDDREDRDREAASVVVQLVVAATHVDELVRLAKRRRDIAAHDEWQMLSSRITVVVNEALRIRKLQS